MTLTIFCCIAWGFLFILDIMGLVFGKQTQMPTIRLIIAEGVVFLLYLTACMSKNDLIF